MKRLLLPLLLLPGMAMADSAWQGSATGPALINRGTQLTSPTLAAAEPTQGEITQIAWRYTLSGPPPSDLRVWLCATSRCVELEGASGTTRGLAEVSAAENLHFVYGVMGTGRLNATLRVLSNEVMVNYR